MAWETQYASLDGTALYGGSDEQRPKSSNFARRSISIFSRRGSEEPGPKAPFIAQAMPKYASGKEKKWMRRRSTPADDGRKPRGTVLNIVPPAKTIQMTALEEEMATSPNEEILSAIGSPTTQSAFEWPLPAVLPPTDMWNNKSIPLAQRTTSKRRSDTNVRIGVWRNGITHWDEELCQDQNDTDDYSLTRLPARPSIQRVSTEPVNISRPARPSLSVVIPSSDLGLLYPTATTNTKPIVPTNIVSVRPKSVLPRIALTTPRTSSEESDYVVSPLEPSSPASRTPTPPKRPSAPVRSDIKRKPVPLPTYTRKSNSSASLSSSIGKDDDSDASLKSSATSFDIPLPNNTSSGFEKRSSRSPSISSSVYSSNSEAPPTPDRASNRPALVASEIPPPMRAPPVPPRSADVAKTTDEKVTNSDWYLGDHENTFSASRIAQDKSSGQPLTADWEESVGQPSYPHLFGPPTPTLSEAQADLHAQLAGISDEKNVSDDCADDKPVDPAIESIFAAGITLQVSDASMTQPAPLNRRHSVHTVLHPPERAPTIPRRSRKREWVKCRNSKRPVQLSVKIATRRKSNSHLQELVVQHSATSALRRSLSAKERDTPTDIAALFQTQTETLLPTPIIVIEDKSAVEAASDEAQTIEEEDKAGETNELPPPAEDVLLHILSAFDNMEDLFNTSMINKGMHRVFKENELDLIRAVTFNRSPPMWELREWSIPREDEPKPSPGFSGGVVRGYINSFYRDMKVIESLKRVILERCQTVIRSETVAALSNPAHPHAQRFNDAFWRIWCFCKIFGCDKGREEDVTGQLDWLKGGLIAHNQDLTATMNMNLDYEMGSVLLNAPEYFAKGNDNQLGARQLYDITEIWACMTTLLEGFHGRTEQARKYGVLDQCTICSAEGLTEEYFLEEWTSYLLTLGPKVVLEMAAFANNSSPAGFAHARARGWTRWNPPANEGSRNTFLKEPVSRMYEERVAATALKFHNPLEEEEKERSRKRVANLAAEIKLARQSSSFKRRPYIDMNTEQPMSGESTRQNSTATAPSIRTSKSTPSLRGKRPPSKRSTLPVPTQPAPPPNFSMPTPRSPEQTVTLWSPRKISPIIEDRVETFNRNSMHNFYSSLADNTTRAFKRLIDKGFSPTQARQALKLVDAGNENEADWTMEMVSRARV